MLDDEEVAATLAALFAVGREDVLIVESVMRLDEPLEVKVLCERFAVGGDFAMQLSIYVRDPRLEHPETLPLVAEFCRRLHCSCLVQDDSPNPYSAVLVSPTGERQAVFLNAERLDEQEEYVIDRPAPTGEEQ
jgi:hypothetical protein